VRKNAGNNFSTQGKVYADTKPVARNTMPSFITALPLTTLLCISSFAQATDFSDLYDKTKSTVVLINTVQHVVEDTPKGITHDKARGLGSGVIINDNLILTASHVVHIADNIEVTTIDGQSYAAKVIASQPHADLAIIKIIDPPKQLISATIGNSDDIEIGEEVVIIGAPYGLSQTLTAGHFSGRRISDSNNNLLDLEFLQTDAPINRGNSGGPMFNDRGELIGIVSHIRSSSGGDEGLGFAASINMAVELFISSPLIWTGMEFVPVSDKLAEAINLPFNGGLLVQNVAYGSLGDSLGLLAGRIVGIIDGQKIMLGGDVIKKLGGQEISLTKQGMANASRYFSNLKESESITMTVYREGKEIQLSTQQHPVLLDQVLN